jgi:hypothetical protein
MAYVYLIFSKAMQNQSLLSDTFPRIIQNHAVICDAESGAVHKAHAVTEKPRRYKNPDSIFGPFMKSALVYFEYKDGKIPNVEEQIGKLATPALQAKAREAYERYMA